MGRFSGSEGKYLRILRDRAFHKQNGLCYHCSKPMVMTKKESLEPDRLSGEHLVRVVDGGKTKPGNVVAAHQNCNQEYNDKIEEKDNYKDWLKYKTNT